MIIPFDQDSTTLHQALEFGFGHDTDAPEAEVIMTLQRRKLNKFETFQFKHKKKLSESQAKITYGVQIIGVDDDFRVNPIFINFANSYFHTHLATHFLDGKPKRIF